jgi:hypothetical protein
MNPSVNHLLPKPQLRPAATQALIDALVSGAGVTLPEDYLQLLRFTDGFEGFVGSGYLVIWSAEEAIPNNIGYGIPEFAPGFFAIGSNGGGVAYAIDGTGQSKLGHFVESDFIGMGPDAIFYRCSTIAELIQHVAAGP